VHGPPVPWAEVPLEFVLANIAICSFSVTGTVGFGYAFFNRERVSRFVTCGATCMRIAFFIWQVTRPLHSPALVATLLLGGMYEGSKNASDAIFIGTILEYLHFRI
jgi:hypothetical protein